jgi:hypothetical protein
MARISHTGHSHPATPAGRATCRDAANIALADAVNAYRKVIVLSKSRPNSAAWRKASSDHFVACKVHANLTGLTVAQVSEKVATIADMLNG